jgi:hypothetical protein
MKPWWLARFDPRCATADVILRPLSRGLETVQTRPYDRAAFVDTLSQPGRPVPEMVDVLARTAPWEKPRSDEH